MAEQMAVSTPTEDELELLLKQVIESAKKELQKEFDNQIKNYSAQNNPLGEQQANKIMSILIEKAVVQRNSLNGKIEHSLSEGGLYRRYYNKIAVINDLTNDAYEKMNTMKHVEERFETKKHLYHSVTGHMYLQKINNAAKDKKQKNLNVDQGKEIDKTGGELDASKTIW